MPTIPNSTFVSIDVRVGRSSATDPQVLANPAPREAVEGSLDADDSGSVATATFVEERPTAERPDPGTVYVRSLAPGASGWAVAAGPGASQPALSGDGTRLGYSDPATDGLIDLRKPHVVVKPTFGGPVQSLLPIISLGFTDASSSPTLDGDGDVVAFTAHDQTYVIGACGTPLPHDCNGQDDVLVADLGGGPPAYTILSRNSTGGTAAGASRAPSVSSDGRLIAFLSRANDLAALEGGGRVPLASSDVFVFDRDPDLDGRFYRDSDRGEPFAIRQLRVAGHGTLVVGTPQISPDGSQVAYALDSQDLGPDRVETTTIDTDDPATPLRIVGTDVISVASPGLAPSRDSSEPSLSEGGRAVLFTTEASEISGSAVQEVMRRDRPAVISTATPTITAAPIRVGTAATATVHIDNAGPAVATGTTTSLQGPRAAEFAITSDRCSGRPIVPGPAPGGCDVTVEFRPVASGPAKVTLTVGSAGSSGNSVAVTINAFAGVGQLALEPDPLRFPAQLPLLPSAPRPVTVTNTGTLAATVASAHIIPTAPGREVAFRKDRDRCAGTTLAPGASCTVTVQFTPPGIGTYDAVLEVRSDAENPLLAGSLQGPGGRAPLTITPEVDFGLRRPGTTADPATLVVTNTARPGTDNAVPATIATSNLALDFAAGATAGSVQPAFRVVTDGCAGTTLRPGESCSIQVVFEPPIVGRSTAQLSVASNGANTPVASLIGTGARGTLVLVPADIDLGAHRADADPITTTVVARNQGPVEVPVHALAALGPDVVNFAVTVDRCTGQVLAPGATCSIEVTFTPRLAEAGSMQVRFDNDGTDPAVTAMVRGVVVPVLRIEPLLGPPSSVPTVIGFGFPPNGIVDLAWVGRPSGTGRVFVLGDGTFHAPMVILDRHGIGERQLAAAPPPATEAPNAPQFGPVQLDDPFQVVLGTFNPPILVSRGT